MSSSRTVVSLLVLSLLAIAEAQSGFFPCHGNKQGLGHGAFCEVVEVPKNLCSACKLKGFNPHTGAFNNCKSIYDLDNGECQAALKNYANLNKCDTVRNNQVNNFYSPANKEGLDYFVYSLCEECCDCVGVGVQQYQYDSLASSNNLFSVRRGNCPAHAVYDICNVLPNIRFFKSEGSNEYHNLPKMCPLLKNWQATQSANWQNAAWVPMSPQVETFLKTSMPALTCGNRGTWNNCVALESAQNRI